MKDKICVVLLTNKGYFGKMLDTLYNVIKHGYKDDICIVIGDDLLGAAELEHELIVTNNNITVKYFTDINFTSEFYTKFTSLNRDEHWRQKTFQYHKLHLFNSFFKQWDFIFYIDSGTSVYNSIDPIINARKKNKLLAHSDAYPSYEWKLATQFIQDDALFNIIAEKYNLNIDYPQTTIMLYDTSIIEDSTFNNLVNLTEECRISKTNDQGIIALYFASIKQLWEQIQLGDENWWYYDYALRPEKRNKPPILLKIPL